MAEPTRPKRDALVRIRTLPKTKERLEKEAQRRTEAGRNTTVTDLTEQCWTAYLPLLEAEEIQSPRFPKKKKP